MGSFQQLTVLLTNWSQNSLCLITAAKRKVDPMDDEETIRRKMRRLTDNYDIHKEIGR